MPRARRKTGDDATNARKRYYRAAERYLKQAKDASGATAARYRALAREQLDSALDTYSKATTQRFSQPIQRIANELGVSLDEKRQQIKQRSDEYAEKIRTAAIDLDEGKSKESLVSERTDAESLRQAEARTLLNSPIGQRVLGGTVDIWRKEAYSVDDAGEKQLDRSKILPALYDYFKVDNLADLLDKIEQITGEDLYKDPNVDAFYESVKITLQDKLISDNSLVE